MGYWGYGLMDGDTPQDVKDSFDENRPVDGEGVDQLVREFGEWGSDAHVVLASLVMEADLPLTPFCRTMAVHGLEDQYKELDTWKEPEERRAALRAFDQQLQAYPVS